mgnify:CR=1 FL=1
MSAGSVFEQGQLEKILVGAFKPKEQKAPIPLKQKKRKVLVLAGPTAVGKTEMSLLLARALGGEIISADSMQVYRGLDIGTAKATWQQRACVPHHLLDIRDVHETFNIVDFYYEARHCCEKLVANDVVPIVVGGAGFYIHSFLYGPPNGPPSVDEVRKALEKEAERSGIDFLYERLCKQDPEYAATITSHDRQKIIRALEIMTLTGNTVSRLAWNQRKVSLNYDFRCWFVHRSRDSLYERVDMRCDMMLADGFLREVEEYESAGIREHPSISQAIGYRQALEYLDSPRTIDDYDEFVRLFKQSSRRYVKKQFTWFKKEPIFRWLDLDLHDTETAVDIMAQDFKR